MLKRIQDKKQKKKEHKDVGLYVNKQRTLVFSTRGILHRDRHLMNDLRDLFPHSRKDSKFDIKDNFKEVNEVADLNNCNNCVFFEARKNKDLYLWVARTPSGPSAKFLVQNVHTMSEVRLTGNCLKGSRPVLHFDKSFDDTTHGVVLKELLGQSFGTPKGHPKAKPFIDHIFSFFYLKGRIYFRNYQISYEANNNTTKSGEPVLVEIGPRFTLVPVKLFAGSFQGSILWENPDYISPNLARSLLKKRQASTYIDRVESKKARTEYLENLPQIEDEFEEVFQ